MTENEKRISEERTRVWNLKRSPGTLTWLLADAENDSSDTQNQSIEVLGKLHYRSTIKFLIKIVNDYISAERDGRKVPNGYDKSQFALHGLGYMDHPRSHKFLKEIALIQEDFEQHQCEALDAFGHECRQYELEFVRQFLRDDQPVSIQSCALWSVYLQSCNEMREEYREILIGHTKSKDPSLRVDALTWLSRDGHEVTPNEYPFYESFFDDHEIGHGVKVSDCARGIIENAQNSDEPDQP